MKHGNNYTMRCDFGEANFKDKNCWNSSPLKFTGRQKRIRGCYLDIQQENVSQK